MGGSTYLINLAIAGVAREEGNDDTRVTMLYVPGIGTWGFIGDACAGTGSCGEPAKSMSAADADVIVDSLAYVATVPWAD